MHPTIETLKNAMAYTKFQDPEVKEATLKLIDEIGADLENPEASYEPSNSVEVAASTLEVAMNEADEPEVSDDDEDDDDDEDKED